VILDQEPRVSAVLTVDSEAVAALQACISALRLLADSELPPPLEQRLRDLSENKEFLREAEREEFTALVDFWRKRAVEKLEAQAVLQRLRAKFPELFEAS
jgi:hypothetical protein